MTLVATAPIMIAALIDVLIVVVRTTSSLIVADQHRYQRCGDERGAPEHPMMIS